MSPPLSLAALARRGARLGLRLELAYSALFLVYACARAGLELRGAAPDAGLLPTLGATWASLAAAVVGFATLLAPLCAGLGAATSLAIGLLQRRTLAAPGRAAALGAGVCLLLSAGLLLFVHLGLGVRWPPTVPETWLFWLGGPLAVYVSAGAATGRALARRER